MASSPTSAAAAAAATGSSSSSSSAKRAVFEERWSRRQLPLIGTAPRDRYREKWMTLWAARSRGNRVEKKEVAAAGRRRKEKRIGQILETPSGPTVRLVLSSDRLRGLVARAKSLLNPFPLPPDDQLATCGDCR